MSRLINFKSLNMVNCFFPSQIVIIRHFKHSQTNKNKRTILINAKKKNNCSIQHLHFPKTFRVNYKQSKITKISSVLQNYYKKINDLYKIKIKSNQFGRWKWTPCFIQKNPILIDKSIKNNLVKSRHYIIDLSNIIIGAKNHVDQHGKGRVLSKLGFLRLCNIDCSGIREKPDISCTIAGSIGSNEFSEAEEETFIGLGCNVYRQKTKGKEQLVDDFLHKEINKIVAKPGSHLLILATGDGNHNSGKSNFPECVYIAACNGFMVEIMSWKKSLSANLIAVQSLFPPGQIKIKLLDTVIDQVLEPMIYPVDGIDPYEY